MIELFRKIRNKIRQRMPHPYFSVDVFLFQNIHNVIRVISSSVY